VLDWGAAHIADQNSFFGSALREREDHRFDETETSSGYTLGYVSPEVYKGSGSAGPSSDIYSLGACLYQLLTNQRPLTGRETDFEGRLADGDFPPPRAVNRHVPAGLEAICLKAMHLEPTMRYASASSLAKDVENWLHDEELEAAPDGAFDKARRYARRHRGVVVTLVVALLVAAFGGWFFERRSALANKEHELRVEASQKLDFALTTFEEMCEPLANNEATNLTVFQPLTNSVQEFIDGFEQIRIADSDMQEARVRELQSLIYRANGQASSDQLNQVERARKIYTSLLASSDSAGQELRARAALNLLRRGSLLVDTRQWKEAEASLNEGRRQLRELDADNSPGGGWARQRFEAEAIHLLGQISLDQGKLFDAEDYFTEAKKLREELLAQSHGAEKSSLFRDLARSNGWLGDVFRQEGDLDAAERAYQESLTLRKRLYDANPTDPERAFQLARGFGNFTYLELVEWRDHDTSAARIEKLKSARTYSEKLVKDFKSKEFKIDFARFSLLLAEILLLESDDAPQTQPLARQQQDEILKYIDDAESVLPDAAATIDEPTMAFALAFAKVLQAETCLDKSPEETHQWSREALAVLSGRDDSLRQRWTHEEYFLAALANAMLGFNETALDQLGIAVKKGNNYVQRLRGHQKYALRQFDQNQRNRLEQIIRDAGTKAVRPL
jgi:tetratricopeptide (TPR) repeat protein